MNKFTQIRVMEFDDSSEEGIERQSYRIEGVATPAQLLSIYKILTAAPRKRRTKTTTEGAK